MAIFDINYPMYSEQLAKLIVKANSDDGLVPRFQVIDDLLDLRLMAAESQELVKRIDRFLSQVPGVTVVSSVWWCSTLADLEKVSNQSILV